MTPNDGLPLHLIWSFVWGVVLPAVVAILAMDLVLRRERRLMFLAKRDARIEPELKIEMVEPSENMPEKPRAWPERFFPRLFNVIFLPMLMQSILSKPHWTSGDWVFGVLFLVSCLFGAWAAYAKWWQRLVEVMVIGAVLCWFHFYPDAAHWLSTAILLGFLFFMVKLMLVHFRKEWASAPEQPGLPGDTLVLKRRFMLVRLSLLVLLLAWMGFYMWMYVWPALPAARAALSL